MADEPTIEADPPKRKRGRPRTHGLTVHEPGQPKPRVGRKARGVPIDAPVAEQMRRGTIARGAGWGGAAGGDGWGAPVRTVAEANVIRDVKTVRGEAGRYVSIDPKSAEAEEVAKRMLAKVVNIADTTTFELASLDAASKAMDRIWGKPKQATELTGKDGGPVDLLHLVRESMKPRE